MASPVTPVATNVSQVATGGVAAVAMNANPNGGILQNPLLPTDQGLGASEPLYVDPTGAAATLQGNGTTFRLEAGQIWTAIPGQTTTTSVNAASSGHKFAGVQF